MISKYAILMEISHILDDKTIKPNAKKEAISTLLLEGKISVAEIINVAGGLKDPAKATCIEALEHATGINPGIATPQLLDFVTECLLLKAPRIKWESARVIGNTAHRFPERLSQPLKNLLLNTGHTGTVVRWSSAFAISRILLLHLSLHDELIPIVKRIIENEEKNSIRKLYSDALKKARRFSS
jgi:hypothetical protein